MKISWSHSRHYWAVSISSFAHLKPSYNDTEVAWSFIWDQMRPKSRTTVDLCETNVRWVCLQLLTIVQVLCRLQRPLFFIGLKMVGADSHHSQKTFISFWMHSFETTLIFSHAIYFSNRLPKLYHIHETDHCNTQQLERHQPQPADRDIEIPRLN